MGISMITQATLQIILIIMVLSPRIVDPKARFLIISSHFIVSLFTACLLFILGVSSL